MKQGLSAMAPTGLLIGSQWCDAADSRTFPVYNPSTEEVLAHVADASEKDARQAVSAAKSAAATWRATPARVRSDILLGTFTLMIDRRHELAELVSLENGKSLADSKSEISYAAEYFRWYAEEAVRMRGELFESPSGANRVLVRYEPVGVCVLVTPWNFPAAMATRKIGPALAAGCTVVLKPASETPLTSLAIASIMLEAGLPPGVLNVVTTTRAGAIVDELLDDEAVRMLSFTGSTEVGKLLLARAAGTVLKTSMELGGNAPFIVLDDADIDEAVSGAMIAKLRNGGQTCTAANRFYVHRDIHDEFVTRLVTQFEQIHIGEGKLASTDCGPLINSGAVDKVSLLVADAVHRGATIMTGGSRQKGQGYFYPPTVLTDVSAEASINHEEIFGPVAAIRRFNSDDEVIDAANATVHGLVSYLYTRDLARGLRLSERLEAGMVALNRGIVSDPAAPFGGVKQSGLGREGSHEGLLEYLEEKYIATTW